MMAILGAWIVTLITVNIANFTRVIILNRDTLGGVKESRRVKKAREELDLLAHQLPGASSPMRCPLWKPKDHDKYTHDEWELFCRGGQKDLLRVIMHLNDHHRWTREQIADFVQEQHDAGNIDVSFEAKLFANREVTT